MREELKKELTIEKDSLLKEIDPLRAKIAGLEQRINAIDMLLVLPDEGHTIAVESKRPNEKVIPDVLAPYRKNGIITWNALVKKVVADFVDCNRNGILSVLFRSNPDIPVETVIKAVDKSITALKKSGEIEGTPDEADGNNKYKVLK